MYLTAMASEAVYVFSIFTEIIFHPSHPRKYTENIIIPDVGY